MWIAAGRVVVNGHVVRDVGSKADPEHDRIHVDGRPLRLPTTTVLIAFHKPRGTIVTRSDPQGRPTIYDHLPKPFQSFKSVGRLDFNSEGLLLLTNDGDLQNRLLHPRFHLPKRYDVTVSSIPTSSQLHHLRSGAGLFRPIEVRLMPRDSKRRATLEMILEEGQNRQIHHMCEAVGLTVEKLKRMAIGPIELGSLAVGTCREVPLLSIQRVISQNGESIPRS